MVGTATAAPLDFRRGNPLTGNRCTQSYKPGHQYAASSAFAGTKKTLCGSRRDDETGNEIDQSQYPKAKRISLAGMTALIEEFLTEEDVQ